MIHLRSIPIQNSGQLLRWIQRIISAVHSAIRGGMIFGEYLVRRPPGISGALRGPGADVDSLGANSVGLTVEVAGYGLLFSTSIMVCNGGWVLFLDLFGHEDPVGGGGSLQDLPRFVFVIFWLFTKKFRHERNPHSK